MWMFVDNKCYFQLYNLFHDMLIHLTPSKQDKIQSPSRLQGSATTTGLSLSFNTFKIIVLQF